MKRRGPWPTIMPRCDYDPTHGVKFESEVSTPVRHEETPSKRQPKCAYYTQARRIRVKQSVKRVMRGAR